MSHNESLSLINLKNSSTEKLIVTLVKYNHEKYQDANPFTINIGEEYSFERDSQKNYFCFVIEGKTIYGFICRPGKHYEYLGKGKMNLPKENKKYKLENHIEDLKGKITILAELQDVEYSIYKDKNLTNEISNSKLYKDSLSSRSFEDDYYYLKIKGEENVYGVIPGVAYYIAKGQVLVEVDTNIIKKPHIDSDIEVQLK
jgi:hypothetical protein